VRNEFRMEKISMEPAQNLLGLINGAFARAIERACGEEYVEFYQQNCAVKQSNNFRKFGDMVTTCASHIFRHHLAIAQQRAKKQPDQFGLFNTIGLCGADIDIQSDSQSCAPCGKVSKLTLMKVTTVSEMGFVRERIYPSALELAEAIVANLPEEQLGPVIADVHISTRAGGAGITSGGGFSTVFIDITSAEHMAWHLAQGHFPCRDCGRFCLGTQGLRTHQVQEHVQATAVARRAAIDTAWQLVVYEGAEEDTCNYTASLSPAAEEAPTKLSVAIPPVDGIEAAKRGDIEAMRAMVTGGWDPRAARDKEHNTPLTWAAGNGHLAACRWLVDHCGMDPRASTGTRKHSRQPIHWSARNGRVDVCAWLVLEHNADVDAPTENGTTPLHLAISQGQRETVRWLVEEGGCDVNRCNGFGCNAAHWSGLRGDVPLLRYLHSRGLDYFHRNDNGRTALHKGGVKGNRAACEWFLLPCAEGGAGMDHRHMQPEQCGDTPMTLAASCSEFELQTYLQEQYDLSVARCRARGCNCGCGCDIVPQ
jgi:hypothetical protein